MAACATSTIMAFFPVVSLLFLTSIQEVIIKVFDGIVM